MNPAPTTHLALRELRRLTGLVQAGLLALDLTRVPGEKTLPLQRHAQLRVGLDEGAGDTVANCPGLPADASPVHAHAQVVGALRTGHLEGRHRCLAVHSPREVVLDRAAVDPGLAVPGPQNHARDGRLAL